MSALFVRVVKGEAKADIIRQAIASVREGRSAANTFSLDADEFSAIPGSPFAYWSGPRSRQAFKRLPPLEGDGRVARVGLQTSDDFRFLRAWWECALAVSRSTQKWYPFAKGGKFAPFYDDLLLVINWGDDGRELKDWAGSLYDGSHWSRIIKNVEFYFRPGLTWPSRTNGLSFRPLPRDSIFGHKGNCLFVEDIEDLLPLCALVNSSVFGKLLGLQIARVSLAQSFEAGLVKQTPVPNEHNEDWLRLGELAMECFQMKQRLDACSELSHAFTVPSAVAGNRSGTLFESVEARRYQTMAAEVTLSDRQGEIDRIALRLYRLEDGDLGSAAADEPTDGVGQLPDLDDEESDSETSGPTDAASSTVSWLVGCVLARYDVRLGLDGSLIPAAPGPFDPLPDCSPAMLVGPDGLPATRNRIVSEEWMRARPNAITVPAEGTVTRPIIPDSEYPIAADWDGILVEDPEHDDDVVRRVREVLHVIWGDGADGIEQEACEMLGVKELRDWFRNPRNFWDDHIKRYSKSRRKAPIYWLLQSSKRSFALWIYYHRLDGDMLAKALTTYVEPKVRREETRLAELKAAFEAQQPTGAAARKAERDIERQEALVSELVEFRAAFDRATKLGLQPDLDDGVVLNIAPLHELVPWKVARQYWDELRAGKYEWSTVSKQLRTKGLVR